MESMNGKLPKGGRRISIHGSAKAGPVAATALATIAASYYSNSILHV